jgi:Uncharacterised nucleotidyltransferase
MFVSGPLGYVEQQLVLDCLSDGPDEPILECCAGPLDWNAIFLSTLWHKVAFLVYARLRRSGAVDVAVTEGALPLLLLNHWKQLARVNEIRSMLYRDVALQICDAAREHDIDLAISKGGVALFEKIYQPYERKTYDVDFLGRRSEMRAIEDVMRHCGFTYGEYSHGLEAIAPPRNRDLRKHLLHGRGLPNFLRVVDASPIDYLVAQVRFRVGSGTAEGNGVPAELLLAHAEWRDGIRVVSWTDLALQMALHVHREAHEGDYQALNLGWNLIKLLDLQRVVAIGGPHMVGEALVARAEELGFTAELAFAIEITRSVLPSSELTEIAERIGPIASVDRTKTLEAIWSLGTRTERQSGSWRELVGPKTT